VVLSRGPFQYDGYIRAKKFKWYVNHLIITVADNRAVSKIIILDVVIHEIPHLEQASSWDCGLTCILMILPSHLADNFQLNKSSICSEEFHNQRYQINYL